ncbi:ABC transporter transmembrane domain-containing protein [Hyphococcus luteus]|nr:ABC transporter transmembrane domain-containing protein [Marinicaulis flavus]
MLSRVREFAAEFFQNSGGKENDLPEPPLGMAAYVASAVINILALALPLTILQVYDRVLPNAAYETLTALVLMLLAAIVIDGLLKYFRSTVVNWTAASFTHKLSVRALTSMLATKPSSFNKTTASEHLERLNAVTGLGNHLSAQSRTVMVDIAFIPVFSLVIIAIGGVIFSSVVALFVLFGFLAYDGTKSLNETINEREAFDARKQDFVIEVLGAIQTVKSNAMEPLMMRRFERLQSAASVVTKRMIKLAGMARTYNSAYAALSTVTIVSVGALLVLNGRLTLGALACCMLLSSQLLQPLMRSLASWNEVKLAQHRRDRIAAIFQECEARNLPPTRYPNRFTPQKVAFKDLTIRHGDAPPLFENLNLEIDAGAFIAIKGDDGSGRSSLLRALIHDAPIAGGEIVIGDEVTNIDSTTLSRRAIRYVGQHPSLFRGSILDNITLFGETPTHVALSASKLVGLDDEVVRMPLGYDTLLKSSTGRDLPTPTAQRIALARAIAMRPSVLVLDDANASLDFSGEQRFVEALEKLRGKTTIVMSTHRPSLLRLADKVYEIRDGKLAPASVEPAQPEIGKAAS